jgi:hypothetical protein
MAKKCPYTHINATATGNVYTLWLVDFNISKENEVGHNFTKEFLFPFVQKV